MSDNPADDVLAELRAARKGAPEGPPPIERTFIPLPAGTRMCLHPTAQIDGGARRVVCKGCGVDLDPIKVLEKVAGEYRWMLHIRTETRHLEATVERLKAEVAKLRATRNRIKAVVATKVAP